MALRIPVGDDQPGPRPGRARAGSTGTRGGFNGDDVRSGSSGTRRQLPTSRTFYEGKSHKQAVLALARRHLDVLWALIRDRHTFTTEPPQRDLAAT